MSYDAGGCCENVSTLFSIHLTRVSLTTTLREGLLGVSVRFSGVIRQTFNGAKNISNKICMYISFVNLTIFEAIKQKLLRTKELSRSSYNSKLVYVVIVTGIYKTCEDHRIF
jgi:hypothetical protein